MDDNKNNNIKIKKNPLYFFDIQTGSVPKTEDEAGKKKARE